MQILSPADFHHEMILAGELNMHTVLEGEPGAPLVIMLHGFPEFWYSWRFQIKPLAAAGYRVAAVDMRGYNQTDKHRPYDVFTVSQDIVNLIRALGYDKAVIVGHDVGGGIAWVLAILHPEIVHKLIVCNLPHPNAMREALNRLYLPQFLKIWYVAAFQIPILPELILQAGNYAMLAAMFRQGGAQQITDEELNYYREAWSQPGALRAMLGYYRAPRESYALTKRDLTVRVPTRLIWGEPDVALDTELARWSVRWCPGLDLQIVPNASHFVMLREPEIVTQYILSFLRDGNNGHTTADTRPEVTV
jgi:pimeloyl-ACP methyl ester carboxylesterase